MVPLERLGTRQSSKDDPSHRPEGRHHRPQTIASGEPRRRGSRHLSNQGTLSPAFDIGASKPIRPTRGGARTAGALGRCDGSGVSNVIASNDVRWRRQWGRHVVPVGTKAVAGLPLSGDERGDATTAKLPHETQRHVRGGDIVAAPNVDHGERPPSLPTTHAGIGQAQATIAEMSATRDVAESTVWRAKSGVVESFTSAMPRITTGAQYKATPLEGDPQEHPQWGGFGIGHVPRFFRGKFGVAGAKKKLIGRKGEGVVGNAGIDHVASGVSGIEYLPEETISGGGEGNASVSAVGGGNTGISVQESLSVDVTPPLLTLPTHIPSVVVATPLLEV